jgi:hypothetical protein
LLKRLCILLVTALAAATLSMVGQAPASAVTYAEVFATDVTVKGDACRNTFIDIYGDWSDADITVSVTGPAGGEIDRATFNDATGTLYLQLPMCGSDRAGTYTVTASVSDVDDTQVVASTTFRLTKVKGTSKAGSRIVTKRAYRAGKTYSWLVGAKLLRKGHPYNRQRVILAAKIHGDWYKIDSTKTRRGIVAWKFKPNDARWRFFYAGNSKTKASASDPFRTPHRGHGRVVNGVDPESLVQRVTDVSVPAPQRHLSVRP